jgi:hypothetical protein
MKRRMSMDGHLALTGGEERYIQGFDKGNVRERKKKKNPGVDGRIITRWIFRKWDVGAWIKSIWLRIGRGGGCLLMW